MTTRRDFLRTSTAAAAVLAGSPALLLRSRADADIIVRNGTVFDGLGGAGKEFDVVIAGGRITSVARRVDRSAAQSRSTRAASRSSPGFIDIHSHGDGSLWEDPRAESLVRQGITTIVVGQDGSSRAPRRSQRKRERGAWTVRAIQRALDRRSTR